MEYDLSLYNNLNFTYFTIIHDKQTANDEKRQATAKKAFVVFVVPSSSVWLKWARKSTTENYWVKISHKCWMFYKQTVIALSRRVANGWNEQWQTHTAISERRSESKKKTGLFILWLIASWWLRTSEYTNEPNDSYFIVVALITVSCVVCLSTDCWQPECTMHNPPVGQPACKTIRFNSIAMCAQQPSTDEWSMSSRRNTVLIVSEHLANCRVSPEANRPIRFGTDFSTNRSSLSQHSCGWWL